MIAPKHLKRFFVCNDGDSDPEWMDADAPYEESDFSDPGIPIETPSDVQNAISLLGSGDSHFFQQLQDINMDPTGSGAGNMAKPVG